MRILKDIIPHQPVAKHCVFTAFALLLLGLGLLPETTLQQFQFQFGSAPSSAWFSAHFIHLNFNHALMNASGIALIWLLVAAYVPSQLLLTLLVVLPLSISLLLNHSDSSVFCYRGFSGAIYGFFAAGIIWCWWQQRLLTLILAVFLVGKITLEQLPGFDNRYLLDSIGGLVAVDAHLYGALTGVALTLAYIGLGCLNMAGCYLPWHSR